MNIIVNKICDKQRFAWFIHLKYRYPLSYTKTLAKWIDENYKYSFSKLTEVEVRYLNEYICKLKIVPTKMNVERKRYIDVSPQPGDELKQEPLTLFHVTFTKVIHYDEMLNERQIQALLKDNHVKSINIEK